MKQRREGVVLLVASISGWKPVGIRSAYATAKAAEIHLAASLAQEFAPHNVRVNAISPGSTIFDGGGWDKYSQEKPDAFAKFQEEEFPYGRLGQVNEIADVAVFLVSDRAGWINGANIKVDGGQRRPSAF